MKINDNTRHLYLFLALYFIIAVSFAGKNPDMTNVARNKPVTASSEVEKYPAANAVNGKISRHEKWMTIPEAIPPHILDIDLQKYYRINRIVIHTGIPEEERTPGESLQAAGFWSVKHFKLQYWDDANWTDIPKSEITENRQISAVLNFSQDFVTYKIRFIAMDGEPINVMEIEVFGEEVADMEVPATSTSEVTYERSVTTARSVDADIKITPKMVGKTMKYVAYNQAYFLPGSNVSGWLDYSGVNSLRVWTNLGNYAPASAVEIDPSITSLSEFESRKSELRMNPENNRFLKWDDLKRIYSNPDMDATNAMVFDYVLEEAKNLNIDIILQINERRLMDDWSHKWQQWQRFYALAYYSAREGDVFMFSMQNEPNHRHSGPMSVEEWLTGMRIVSDAVRCAVEDVNNRYSKNLTATFAGPVTAGTNVDWWAEVVQNVRKDYRGDHVDYDLIDLFSTHSYNSPAAGYSSRVENIREIIRDNHPAGKEIPVVYTEIGRWMNAYLIDKEETMDSPSLFTEWAGIYTNNMLNGAYGMWAFKFASNTSSTYPRGIKSGHHFTWNGKRVVEDAYKNIALDKPVIAYNSQDTYSWNVTDGDISDNSSWRSDSGEPEKWLQIHLLEEETIGSAIIYTGSSYGVFTGPDRVRNFKLQYRNNDEWVDIPGASESDCKYVQVLLEFEEPVRTRDIRFVALEKGPVIVREIKLYRYNNGPDTAPESYDISGIHRTGEVVRLFAKGFKDQRDLLHTEVASDHGALDVCTTYDPYSGNYYMWLVQRALFDYNFNIDLSGLSVPAGHPVISEVIGPDHFGEVVHYVHTNADNSIDISLPAQSVMLITIPGGEINKRSSIEPLSDAMVRGGKYVENNYGSDETMSVSLDASNPVNNKVSYIHFDPSVHSLPDNNLSLLGINGYVDRGEEPMRIHVYGFPSGQWEENKLTWNNAPNLESGEALIKNVGSEVFVAGQIAFNQTRRYHYLDVTRHINNHPQGITFVVVRETRHIGDYGDKGRNVIISSRESDRKPVIISY